MGSELHLDSADKMARVWDIAKSTSVIFRLYAKVNLFVAFYFDSRQVLSCSRNGTKYLWNLNDFTSIRFFRLGGHRLDQRHLSHTS